MVDTNVNSSILAETSLRFFEEKHMRGLFANSDISKNTDAVSAEPSRGLTLLTGACT
jgi:hypothetical protein